MNIISNSGKIAYGIKEYILQSDDEVINLPLNIAPGSSATNYVSGTRYVLVSEEIGWVQDTTSNSGGGGSLDETNIMTKEEILAILQ